MCCYVAMRTVQHILQTTAMIQYVRSGLFIITYRAKWLVQSPHVNADFQTHQPSAILEPSARPSVTVKPLLALFHLKDVNHASLAGARTSFHQSASEAL